MKIIDANCTQQKVWQNTGGRKLSSAFVILFVLWFGAGHYLFSFLLLSSSKVFQSAFVPGLTSYYSRTSPSLNVSGNYKIIKKIKMEQSNLLTRLTPKSYLRIGLTILLILFAGKFVINDALPYFGFDEAIFGRYWNYRWPLIGHISGGLIALSLGPFQFWKSFRNKFINTHRWMGRIYLTAILIGTISATYLAWTSSIRVNFSWAFALQGLAFAWITTASMAYISVMRRHIIQHKEWMIRSYVVTFAFVTFRWLTDLPIAIQLMNKFEERGPTIIWLSWTIPLLITEIVLSWKKK